jgi:enoyl-CoA hydratase
MSTVTYSKEGTFLSTTQNIAKITLNRPDALNAFSPELLTDLKAALDQAEQDKDIRVVIISGEGKSFSAGADLRAMSTLDGSQISEFTQEGLNLFKRIEEFPKAVIAAINGICLGGGLELAMACDIRIAAAEVKMGTPEVSLGLIPAWGGSHRLPYLIGMSRAKEMILTGTIISSEEAEKLGLVSKVVPADELASTASFMGAKIADNAPIAVHEAKRVIDAVRTMNIEDANKVQLESAMKLSATKDLAEGIKAMLEKRKPVFSGE